MINVYVFTESQALAALPAMLKLILTTILLGDTEYHHFTEEEIEAL